jgi:CheY-like chemotaxis protein
LRTRIARQTGHKDLWRTPAHSPIALASAARGAPLSGVFDAQFGVHRGPPQRRAIFRHNEVGGIHMETVLIVDDTPCVLEFLRRVLLIEGYTVLTASNGLEAVEAAAQWPDCIDLLITDVAIPRMSCTLMVENLQAQRPRLKVVYTSGHSRDVVAAFGVPSDAFFLQKPFLPAQLAQAVRACA